MSANRRFQFFLDLISNVGSQAQTDSRLVEQAQRRMAEATDRTASRVDRLETALSSLSRNTSTERQVAFMGTLARSIDHARDRALALRKTLAEGVERMPELAAGGAAAFYAGRGVALPPLRAFADLEAATAELRIAMTDASGKVSKDFDKIRDEALRLGNKLPGSTKDFIESAVALMQQGVPAAVVANGGLKAAGGFGVLTGMGQYEAAETVAKMREAYGLKDSELPAMADLMQRARFAFGIAPQDFRTSAQYAAPIYNTLGLTGLDNARKLLAVQGMAASVGLESSSFGTNFAAMLQRVGEIDGRLGRNSKEAKEVREMLGKHRISMSFYDSEGRFSGVENMMAQLAKLRALKPYDQQQALTRMFGAEAGRPAQILVQKGMEEYQNSARRLDAQASLDQRLEIKTSTLTSVMDALTGSFTNLLAAVGRPTGEAAKPLLGAANGWTGSLSEWADEHPFGSTALLAGGVGLASLAAFRGSTGLWRRLAARQASSSAGGAKLAWPTLEGAAPVSRLAVAGRVLGRTLPWAGGALGAYDVMTDEALTGWGKARGMGEVGAGMAGGYGGWLAGAALGSVIAPGAGTLIGGLLGGFGGGFGTSRLYDWLMPNAQRRDVVGVTAPNGALVSSGAANSATQVSIGEGRLQVEVRVSDERISAATNVMRSPALVRIESGVTDPGSFGALGGALP